MRVQVPPPAPRSALIQASFGPVSNRKRDWLKSSPDGFGPQRRKREFFHCEASKRRVLAGLATRPHLAHAKEILALNKMNWNSTQFDGGLPLTLTAAYGVGNVLKHVERIRESSLAIAFICEARQ